MDEKVFISALMEVYGKLLTDKQLEIAELYFSCDLSLGEVAEIKKISRQSVSDAVNTVKKELLDYETKLKLLEIKLDLKKLADEIGGETSKRITEIIEK